MDVSAGSVARMLLAAVRSTVVPQLLADRPAVVLERIARGGGATSWYVVSGPDRLEELSRRLRPGSAVSFFFDGRVERRSLDDATVHRILEVVDQYAEAVVGVPQADGITVEVGLVGGLDDLTTVLGGLPPGTPLYVGPFPARDDDGVGAVTFDLPDADGVRRRHPH